MAAGPAASVTCPSCGEENPGRFRLCGFCGTPLTVAVPPAELRRTVTIVFSDLVGSTAIGERLDPESVREVMRRYFAEMRTVLERHGGRIEKFIGDAIMAVFGLPRAHEDDALRAVRAAGEMQAALASLNEELDRRWGVRLANRTGVNTGEVVAADSPDAQTLVTGDAVNVAARLEQAAPPLEVLIGPSTHRLVRHAVDVEAVEPLELKGKLERVHAYRLLSVRKDVDGVARRHEAELVGRESELALLDEAFALACEHRRAQLVTLVGEAGLGKSRLIQELRSRVAHEAAALGGRALPYGEGITFWPLHGVVREAAGISEHDGADVARERLAGLLEGRPEVTERIASAIGLSTEPFAVQDVFWAARELLRELASVGPLLVSFEDLHWAEPTFLDLVEQLLEGVDAPLLLLCNARPELLDERPRWRDMPDSTVIELQPLSAGDSERVIENALGAAGLDDELRAHVVAAAQGNPLFVEQLVAMLVDEGVAGARDGGARRGRGRAEISVPPTIQILLGARLDRLGAEERAVVDAAAVIGQAFPVEAVAALVPEQLADRVGEQLRLLAGRRLVDAEDDGETFRFRHVLIRDTAYDRLLKRTRADLHERFVAWAEPVNRERGRETEFEEILGYHLEQAHDYLADLGPLDDHGRALGLRGSEKLAGAGRRAFQRGDMHAAASLLRRAAALRDAADLERLRLLPTLAEALMETGAFSDAELVTDELLEHAPPADATLRADALLTRWLVRHHVADDLAVMRAEVLDGVEALLPALERAEAHAELATAWRMIAFVHGSVCRWGEQVAAVQQAIVHARAAGNRRLEARLASAYTIGLCAGPTPVPEAIARVGELLEHGLSERQAEAIVRCSLADLLAMGLDLEAAREQYRLGWTLLEELGGGVVTALAALAAARVEVLAGNAGEAERVLRRTYDELGAIGERYFRPLVGAMLAETLVELSRIEEARDVSAAAAECADPDDIETLVRLRSVEARLAAARDELPAAVEHARAAVELTSEPDAPPLRAEALATAAAVLAAAGSVDEARAALAEARDLCERKGDLAFAERLALAAAAA